MSVTRDQIDAICGTFPGARKALPPELVSWKVGEKMFATFGDFGEDTGVSVKCPDVETATMLIDAGEAVKAPYFHRSWVRLPFETTQEDFARHRLGVSYDTVRSGLKKSVRDSLPPRKT